jgi:hypothetical protein
MPKKKTGQRKKAEKMKLRQKDIRARMDKRNIVDQPCNFSMECDRCHLKQKNRAFCYFCQNIQRFFKNLEHILKPSAAQFSANL